MGLTMDLGVTSPYEWNPSVAGTTRGGSGKHSFGIIAAGVAAVCAMEPWIQTMACEGPYIGNPAQPVKEHE